MSTYHWLNFPGPKNVQNVSVQLIIFEIRPKRYLLTGAWAQFLWTSSTEPPVTDAIFVEHLFYVCEIKWIFENQNVEDPT